MLSGYLKVFLNGTGDEPIYELHGDWRNKYKKEKVFKKPRNTKITFHMFNQFGDKYVETQEVKISMDDLSRVIYAMGRQIIDENPEHEIDTFASYAVVRL
ncbi:hypothetical protein [Moraxella lacunata]|uniref:Uncharacterized protein n=1 Tax=Moraxella lacunata TaxID=477 RepID=A0A1V4GVT2_MORLA|nr:hypothetical protein [Moraxella lacunata]OPH36734.1 hypothetical protein B5J94_06730 [Moraxella lacunata]